MTTYVWKKEDKKQHAFWYLLPHEKQTVSVIGSIASVCPHYTGDAHRCGWCAWVVDGASSAVIKTSGAFKTVVAAKRWAEQQVLALDRGRVVSFVPPERTDA